MAAATARCSAPRRRRPRPRAPRGRRRRGGGTASCSGLRGGPPSPTADARRGGSGGTSFPPPSSARGVASRAAPAPSSASRLPFAALPLHGGVALPFLLCPCLELRRPSPTPAGAARGQGAEVEMPPGEVAVAWRGEAEARRSGLELPSALCSVPSPTAGHDDDGCGAAMELAASHGDARPCRPASCCCTPSRR
jgi:hypothetical protein